VTLSTKLLALLVGAILVAALSADVTRKVYTGELTKRDVTIGRLSVDLNKQNAGIRAWLLEGAKLKAQIAAAEARQPIIETRTVERVRVVRETAPAPAAPCVEVRAWQREQFKEFCSRWQQPPR